MLDASKEAQLKEIQHSAASRLAETLGQLREQGISIQQAIAAPDSRPSSSPSPAPPSPASAPEPPAHAVAPAEAAPVAPAAPAQPAPAATPSATPAATGSPPASQQPGPITINPDEDLTEAARKALEIAGGDVNAALERMLQYNNRLAELRRAEKSGQAPPPAGTAAPPASADPSAPPPAPTAAPAPAPEPPAPPADPAVTVEKQVAEILRSDPECVRLASEYRQNNTRLSELYDEESGKGSISELVEKVRAHELRLTLPEVTENEYLKDSIADELRGLRADLQIQRLEYERLSMRNERVVGRFNEKRGEVRHRLEDQARRSEEETRRKAESADRIERDATELTLAWKPALHLVAAKHNLPESAIPRLDRRARTEALANLNNGIYVHNLPEFLEGVVSDMVAEADEWHRHQTAQHGNAAHLRTQVMGSGAIGNPPASVPANAPAAPQPTGRNPLDALYEQKRAGLSDQFRRFGTG